MVYKLPILCFDGCRSFLIFLIFGIVVIAVSYNLSKGKAYLAYPVIINENQNNVQGAINLLFSPMISTALLVEESNIQMKYCNLPLDSEQFYSDFNYRSLISIMNSQIKQNNTIMQSIGIISVDNAGSSTPDFSNKISCELALDTFGLGCSDYVYACSDNSSVFPGFCAFRNGTANLNTTVYVGQDSGLTSAEISLFSNKNIKAIFLPIFNLLGKFSLTYERSHWCDGDSTAYAVSLAQKNLDQLDDYLSTLSIGRTGVAYIIERDTGLLVSTSTVEQLINSTGGRVLATDAINNYIWRSADFLTQRAPFYSYTSNEYFDPRYDDTHGLLIDIRPCEYTPAEANLNWLSIVAIPESDYAGWIYKNRNWSIGAAVITGMCCLIFSLFTTYCFIARPIKDPKKYTWIAEIQTGRDALISK